MINFTTTLFQTLRRSSAGKNRSRIGDSAKTVVDDPPSFQMDIFEN